jgi:hypothetical protein
MACMIAAAANTRKLAMLTHRGRVTKEATNSARAPMFMRNLRWRGWRKGVGGAWGWEEGRAPRGSPCSQGGKKERERGEWLGGGVPGACKRPE